MIFSDDDRSEFDSDHLPPNSKHYYWTDKRIPAGSVIRTVEMLYRISDSSLEGMRFLDDKGLILVAVGNNGDRTWLNDPDYFYKRSHIHTLGIRRFDLRDGHWLVGAKSGSRGTKIAKHHDF